MEMVHKNNAIECGREEEVEGTGRQDQPQVCQRLAQAHQHRTLPPRHHQHHAPPQQQRRLLLQR